MNCCPFLRDKEIGTGKLLTQRHEATEKGRIPMNLRFCAVLCMLMALNGEELRAETSVFWVANGPMASDFDGDGKVTFTDFLHFVNNF